MSATIYQLPARRVLEAVDVDGEDCPVYDLQALRDVHVTLSELVVIGEFEQALASGWKDDTGVEADCRRRRSHCEDRLREIGPVFVRAQVKS